MPGAANALKKARDRAGGAELADEVDVADIDTEFERGRGDQGLELAMFEPLLGIEPLLLGEAAVMRRHVLLPEQIRELARSALGHASRIDENERRSVFRNQIGHAPVDPIPDFCRHYRFEGRIGDLQCQIARATVC